MPSKIGLPENRKRLKGLGQLRETSKHFDEGYDVGFKAGIEYHRNTCEGCKDKE